MVKHGFNYRYYLRIESGDQNLSLMLINRLAKAFGVEPADLLKSD